MNPKKIECESKTILWVGSILNVAIPTVYAISVSQSLSLFITFSTLNLILQLNSLMFFTFALKLFRQQSGTRLGLMLNSKTMCMHYVCFVLFFLALTVSFLVDMIYPPGQNFGLSSLAGIARVSFLVFLQISLGIVIYSLI